MERSPADQDPHRDQPDEAVVVHLPSRRAPPTKPERPKRYSDEFRADAVALARRQGVTVAGAAQQVGVSASTLRRWLRDASTREVGPERTDPEQTDPEQTDPEQTDPEQTDPEQTDPEQTDPEQTDPEQTDPEQQPRSYRPDAAWDARPVRQRIDDEWPDWRAFDWPVLPVLPDQETRPPEPATGRGGSTAPGRRAVTPRGRPSRPARPRVVDSAAGAAPAAAAARDLERAVVGDGVFAATARLGPLHRLVVVLAAFTACIALSRLVPESYSWRPTVSAFHVMSLVVSFGAVLLVDWHGLLWLSGRRALTESTRLAAAASPIIWAGLGGLFLTGTLLRPDIGSPLTLLKLALVLAVCVNGAVMAPVRLRLASLSADASPVDVPEREWHRMMLSTAVSQVGWWGAVVIGFVNAAT
ncbi:hypothetical protein DN585_16885 [Intrasporangium calvum]|nr:hypothetical protein DN585_16885 [Intrasporangium calvum]